jgi:hypothetical protein
MRRSPLKPGKPIARGTGLARTVPLRQVSAKRPLQLAQRHPTTVRLVESRAVYRAACAVVDARAGGRCELCAAIGPLQHHHRKARQAGGSSRDPSIHSPANLLGVCLWCHEMAEEHPDRWAVGWKVHRTHDPAAVPVLLTVGGWEFSPEWYQIADDGYPDAGPEGGRGAVIRSISHLDHLTGRAGSRPSRTPRGHPYETEKDMSRTT